MRLPVPRNRSWRSPGSIATIRPKDSFAGVNPSDPNFIPDGYGTGVVVGREGLILTYYHVLGLKSRHFVTTCERKTYPARIKAADPRSDLAVLEDRRLEFWLADPAGRRLDAEEGADRRRPGQSLRDRQRRAGQRQLGDRGEPGRKKSARARTTKRPVSEDHCISTAC